MRSFLTLALLLLLSLPAHAQELDWHDLEDAFAVADTTGRLVLVDVWAPWCGWCHKMKREVYPALASELRGAYVFTRLNRDDTRTRLRLHRRRASPLRLAQQWGIDTVPGVVVLRPDGTVVLRATGFLTEDDLRPALQAAARKARGS